MLQTWAFNFNWHPLLTTASPSILQSGSPLTASGSRFRGISEASGGNGVQNASSNYPLVQLLSLANEQTLFLLADATTGWSDTSFTSTPITLMTTSSSGFPIGYALVTVFTNGIPSQSQFVLAATSTPSPTPTPTASPSATATATPTATATATPTPTPTATPVGIPCGDLVSFQAHCKHTVNGDKLQAKLTLTDTSHSGQQVTITVDGNPNSVRINGNIAKLQINNEPLGQHTVTLTNPAGCFAPVITNCQ